MLGLKDHFMNNLKNSNVLQFLISKGFKGCLLKNILWPKVCKNQNQKKTFLFL